MSLMRINIGKQQRGISLVELMIGMVIGLILMLGVATTFDSNRRTNAYLEGLSQLQEEGRFAMEFLADNIRMSGYPANSPPGGNKIQGVDATTDGLSMRFTAEAGDTDCLDNPVVGTVINQFRINNSNLQCSGDGVTWVTYVPNVEDMQFLFGEDINADGVPNRFMRANQNPTWANVVNVRVSLLVRSEDNKSGAPIPYTNLAGTSVLPTDKRLRRRFVSTINLRN